MNTLDGLWGLLVRALARFPEASAITDRLGTWTCRELASHATAFAAWLARRGVLPGDRVVLTAYRSRLAVAMAYGCAQADVNCIPLNPSMRDFHRRHVIVDAEPKLDLRDPAAFWPEVEQLLGSSPAGPEVSVDPTLLLYTSGSTGDYGRRDNISKCNGIRTSTAEIGVAARDLPGVGDAVVLPPTADRDVVLCFVGAMEPDELVSELRARLEANKIPGELRRFESFPLTTHDKIDRQQVVAQVEEVGR